MCGFCNVWVCVCLDFVKCVCVDFVKCVCVDFVKCVWCVFVYVWILLCVGVSVMWVLVFTVFLYCFFYVYYLFCLY